MFGTVMVVLNLLTGIGFMVAGLFDRGLLFIIIALLIVIIERIAHV